MSDTDYKAGLPIRSESDGTDEKVVVKIVDGTIGGSNQVSVDTDSNLHVLAEGHDPAGAAHPIRTTELGALNPDGVYDAANNTKPGNSGMVASTRTASPSDTTQTNRLTSVTASTVHSLDTAIHDSAGLDITTSNPLPVTIIESAAGVSPVTSPQDALAVAAGASGNMDYAVTASKTLSLKRVMCSASGRGRFELQTSPDGAAFTRLMVKYGTAANPNVDFDLSVVDKDVSGTGSKVRVVFKNTDNSAADGHTLFLGTEA